MIRLLYLCFGLLPLGGTLRAQSSLSDSPLLWVPGQGVSPATVGSAPALEFGRPFGSDTFSSSLGSDSLYLIRPARYRFYRRLHRYLADTAASDAGASLLASYQRSLLRTEVAYDQLLRHYHVADSLAARTRRSTQATLLHLQHSLDRVQTRLMESEHALVLVERQAKQQRRRSFFRGLACGSALGATLLTGLILAAR